MCISQLICYQGRQIFVNTRAENLGWGSNAWLQICDILSPDIFFFSHLPLSFNPLLAPISTYKFSKLISIHSLKNELREFDKRSKLFSLCDYLINSHNPSP